MTTNRVDIVVDDGGSARRVTRDIKGIGQAIADAGGLVPLLGRGLRSLATVGLAGASVGAAALAAGLYDTAKQIKETASAAKQLGIGVENMSRLDFAARSGGVATAELAAGMATLQGRQVEAAKGTGEIAKLFGQMGVAAVDANGKLRGTDQVLADVANFMQRMPNDANRAALATKLFGSEGAKMAGILKDGSAGLAAMAVESDKLGWTLSSETVNGVAAVEDEIDKMKIQMQAIYRQAMPTLLPQLQEFGRLLNSPEVAQGFNTIIQGAMQAVTWMTKFATTTSGVIKFIGEEIAARVHGADAQDTVRVEQRIAALKEGIAGVEAIRDRGVLGMWDFLKIDDGVLNFKDFVTGPQGVVDRLQGELEKEQNKLKLGVELNDAAAAKALKDAQAAAAALPTNGGQGNPAAIDWGALGGGGGGKGAKDRSAERAARELEQLQRALANTVGSIDPVLSAQRELARAQDVFAKATEKGLISQEKAAGYMEHLGFMLRDQLDPLGAVNREMSEQIRVAGMLNEERVIEQQLLQTVDSLRRSGITLTAAETAAMREQLKVLERTNQLAQAKEGFLAQSRGGRDKAFGVQAEALGGLVASGDIGGADTFNIVNQLLGGNLDNTRAAMEAQAEQFVEYYARIDELRQADVLSAQQASEAIKAIKRAELDANLARTEQALGAAAGLMQSNSKEAFRVGQAAAIGQAIVNTYTAATAAYQSAAAIPYVGWILGPAAAAGAIAAGMAQVSAIRSQQMPAYRTGGEYVVGGSGGVDSQTVAMRATPGEKISINTPSQARAAERLEQRLREQEANGGGGSKVVQNITVVQRGRADRRTAGQETREMRRATERQFMRA